MKVIVFAEDGNVAKALCAKMRSEEGNENKYESRQINAFGGQVEQCDAILMLDPSKAVESAHEEAEDIEIIRDYDYEVDESDDEIDSGSEDESEDATEDDDEEGEQAD